MDGQTGWRRSLSELLSFGPWLASKVESATAPRCSRGCDSHSLWRPQTRDSCQWGVLLPESESFWSPLAPAEKGSFLLEAFSFISLTPSLRSNLGVLFDNTLSWRREREKWKEETLLYGEEMKSEVIARRQVELSLNSAAISPPLVTFLPRLLTIMGFCRGKKKTFSTEFLWDSWLPSWRTKRQAGRGRISWRQHGSVVYSCWKQSPVQVCLLSTDVNTYVLLSWYEDLRGGSAVWGGRELSVTGAC